MTPRDYLMGFIVTVLCALGGFFLWIVSQGLFDVMIGAGS